MFVNKLELEKVKTDDTALLAERFTSHTAMEAANAKAQDKKMDEIITLIKESHTHIDSSSAKIHADLVDRLDREYTPASTIETKLVQMKNCCRQEFEGREAANNKHLEITKDCA